MLSALSDAAGAAVDDATDAERTPEELACEAKDEAGASTKVSIDVTSIVSVQSPPDAEGAAAASPINRLKLQALLVPAAVADVKTQPTIDVSVMREVVAAARRGSREEVASLAHTIKRALPSSSATLAAQLRGKLNQALLAACSGGHARIVRELLSAGADPTAVTHEGQSPLELAAAAHSLPTLRVLLAHGRECQAVPRQGAPSGRVRRWRGWRGGAALERACELGDERMVRLLLDSGIAVTRRAMAAAAAPRLLQRHERAGAAVVDLLPLLVTAYCASDDVYARGLRVHCALRSLCAQHTAAQRATYWRVRRQMLTHVLQMSTEDFVHSQARGRSPTAASAHRQQPAAPRAPPRTPRHPRPALPAPSMPTTRGTCLQVRSLREMPYEGFADAVFLAQAFIMESNARHKANDRLSGDLLGQMANLVQARAVTVSLVPPPRPAASSRRLVPPPPRALASHPSVAPFPASSASGTPLPPPRLPQLLRSAGVVRLCLRWSPSAACICSG